MTDRSKFIDYARGLSIFTIILYHFLYRLHLPKPVLYAASFGGAGVHLFFFASGFGLALSKYNGYINFLKRRLNKVLIPYYVVITIIFLLNLAVKIYPDGMPAYLSHIFLYKMFSNQYESSFGIQFWFVSTIIQFYLVFPLLLWFLQSEKYVPFLISALIVSLAYSIGVSLSPYAKERVFNGFFLQYLWEFVLGMVIARKQLLNAIIDKPIWYFFIAVIICAPATAVLAIKGGVVGKNFNDIFSFLGYTSVLIIAYKLLPLVKKFGLWFTTFSYPVYLLHMLLYDYLKHTYGVKFFTVITLPLVLIATIAIAYVFNLILNQIIAAFDNKAKAKQVELAS